MASCALLGAAVWLTLGNVVRAILQALILLLLARNMPIDRYGTLVALVSLLMIFVPLVGAGYEFELLRKSSGGEHVGRAWHTYLSLVLLSALVVMGLVVLCAHLFFDWPVDALSIGLLVFAELFAVRVLEGGNRLYQGQDCALAIIKGRLAFVGLRLLLLVGALSVGCTLEVSTYAYVCFWAAVVFLLVWHLRLSAVFNIRPRLVWVAAITWRQQAPTAVSFGFDRVMSNADKLFVERLDSPGAVANYSVAARLVDLLCIPMLALVTALQPQIFRSDGRGSIDLRYCLVPILYVGLMLPLFWCWGEVVVVWLLGVDYTGAGELLLLLLFMPITAFGKYILTSRSIAAGAHGVLIGSAFGAMCLNLLLNLWLVPAHGAQGAVMALLAGEFFLILCAVLGLCVFLKRRGEVLE